MYVHILTRTDIGIPLRHAINSHGPRGAHSGSGALVRDQTTRSCRCALRNLIGSSNAWARCLHMLVAGHAESIVAEPDSIISQITTPIARQSIFWPARVEKDRSRVLAFQSFGSGAGEPLLQT